ncbi:flagellar hook-associated protein 3 [Desulfovibrio aerotolerans]|uniref:Flagellar hook-associated protein 3 n=1 Tax=Solidesulfovibrio aerotolerans TaxID=295255 RepID=A0A7C9ITQ6_9BACT|nr:flagellar hook-associated protein 3 [Solidesulfovibrio aerotolerans]MYL84847.1 flagellar hook-associated protein 3 [Solidesulfovibrio aerotolerans]
MVLRVAQQTIYGSIIQRNNASLARLMETNLQSSTQKRINAPSDDPNGAAMVLQTRCDISQLAQYKSNIASATGWLQQSDSALTSVSTLITTIKGYAEQGATGSVTDENRGEIASAVRQYFQQLISQANTTYDGNALYAGQKVGSEAFSQSLSMNSNDTTFDAAVAANGGFTISGDAESTLLVQFTDTNTPPGFTYSSDGGATWKAGTYNAPPSGTSQELNLGGVTMQISDAALAATTVSADHADTDGTWMWIRPTAVYNGNTNDTVSVVNTALPATNVVGSAAGNFSANVAVRIDDNNAFTNGTTFGFSYSTDGGRSWVTGNTSGTVANPPGSVSLPVPGGNLTLTTGGDSLAVGNQFFIQPSTADITVAISPTDKVVVNGVGKDIFGGIYNNQAVTFEGSVDANLFETVGKLVGYLETNNQQGCQDALDQLTASQNHLLTVAASVGARENRVTAAGTMVDTLAENSDSSLSKVEDADLTALITRLAQQELAYQAVLKSSSTVMNLSLVSYI